MSAPFSGGGSGHSSSNIHSPASTPSSASGARGGQQPLALAAAAMVQQQQQHASGTNTPSALPGIEHQLQQQQQQHDLRSLQLQQFAALMQSHQQPQQPLPAPHAQMAQQPPPPPQQIVHQQQQQQLSNAFIPQHLLEATVQQNCNNVNAGVASGAAVPSASAQLSAATLGFYQQLFALQQQQAVQHQQHGGGGSTVNGSVNAVAATPAVATLPQQFNAALHLQNSPATTVLPQQLASAPSGAPTGGGGLNALLGGLLGGTNNSALLHSLSLLGGGAAATVPTPGATGGGGNAALLTALAAQLLLPQQQQIVQPPASNQLTASLLQMLNPATATLYAYQNYLQQQQQQTPAPTAATAGQLQLIAQLLAGGGVSAGGSTGNGGAAAVGAGGALGAVGLQPTTLSAFSAGGQQHQQHLLAALAAQQAAAQQQQPQQQQPQHQQQQPQHQQQHQPQHQQQHQPQHPQQQPQYQQHPQQPQHPQQLQHQQQPQQQPQQQQQPTQQEETRILLEQLIRQQQQHSRDQQQQREREQQQKHQQQLLQQQLGRFNAAAVTAGVCAAELPPQQQQQQVPQLEQSPTMTATAVAAFASAAQEQLHQQHQHTPSMVMEHQQQQQQLIEQLAQQHQQANNSRDGSVAAGAAAQQQRASTPTRLLTSEAVQDRISRLISENEAIVEPNPVLLKRRPYQRQGTSNSMTSQTSENAGTSQRCSPGVRSPGGGVAGTSPKLHPATTRSFSLHEAGFMRFGGGSLTSGQPINRNPSMAHSAAASLTCNFCQLKFPNEAGLEAHEPRCSKKDVQLQQQPLQKQQSQSQLKLPSLQQQQQQMQQFQQQLLHQQQQLEHQSTIAALVGGGKGVARELVINGAAGGGRASVPSANNATVVRAQQPQPSRQFHLLGQSNSDSRLKKRGLAAEYSHTDSSGGSAELLVDPARGSVPEPGLAESSKMARIECCSTSGAAIDLLHRRQSFSCASSSTQQQQYHHQQQHAQLNQQRSGSQETQRHVQQQQQDNFIGGGTNAAAAALSQLHQQQRMPPEQQAQPQQQPVLTMRDAIIFAITYSTDLRSTVKMPYFLTLTAAELETGGADLAAGGATTVHLRGRTRNITSETFVCLNKLRPTASEQFGDNCSAYSVGWSSPLSDFADEQRLLAQLFLSAHTTAARTHQDPLHGDFTLAASPASTQLRTTHSSFWSQQQLHLKRSHQQHQPSAAVVEAVETPTAAVVTPKSEALIMPEMGGPPPQPHHQHSPLQSKTSSKMLIRSDSLTPIQQSTATGLERVVVKTEMVVDDKENSTASAAKLNNGGFPRKPMASPMLAKFEKRMGGRGRFELNSLAIPKSSHSGEMEVYIRGRGRGRYVCERCGIRCKKPSMLKKHLRSHTNIRPFACSICNFSFKTKGNLTKHLVSKAHRRKVMDAGGNGDNVRTSSAEYGRRRRANAADDDEEEEEGEGRLVVAEEEDDDEEGENKRRRRRMGSWGRMDDWEADDDEDDDEEADDDDDEEDEDGSPNGEVPPPPPGTLTYRRFGQENILVERETHTPPTLWTLMCPEQGEWNGNGCPSSSNTLGGTVPMDTDDKGWPEDEGASSEWERAGDKKRRPRLANMRFGGWPEPEEAVRERGCHSAPPAALCSPDNSRARRRRNQQAKVLRRMREQQRENNNMEEGALAEVVASVSDVQLKQPQTPPSPVPLANFIPQQQPCQQQPAELQQQPSLAAQLAVGLLASAPFRQAMPIGVAYPYNSNNAATVVGATCGTQQQMAEHAQMRAAAEQHAQQQLMFSPLEHHRHASAFAPPTLASSAAALLLLETSVTAANASGIGTTLPTEVTSTAFIANDALLHGQSTLGAFLATDAQQLLCTLCGRKFRKESELSLHKQTHLIEQQNAVARHKNAGGGAFQCGECPTVVRSKVLLARHSESVHASKTVFSGTSDNVSSRVPPLHPHLVPSVVCGADPPPPASATASPSAAGSGDPFVSLMLPPSVSAGAPSGGSASALTHQNNHHRNFLCTDCNLGFRSHGVLAKHLRSKNHVKTLVSLGKLPEEANHLLAKEHSKVLGSIDAGDCEKALHSTKQLLAKMREQLGLDASSDGGTAAASCTTTSVLPAWSAVELLHASAAMMPNSHAVIVVPPPTLAPSTTNAPGNSFLPDQQFGGAVVAEPSPQLRQDNGSAAVISPHVKLRISNSISAHKRIAAAAAEQLPHGLKRKNDEATLMLDELALFPNSAPLRRDDAFSSPLSSRAKISREEQQQQQISQADSPLHSLAQVAVEVAAAAAAAAGGCAAMVGGVSSTVVPPALSSVCSSASPSMTLHPQLKPSVTAANVWVPPKLEQLTTEPSTGGDSRKSSTPDLHNGGLNGGNNSTDRLGTLLSNRSAEETSESTGTRSESSTPVQRTNAQQPLLGFTQPLAATRCQLCDHNFESPTELTVHFHADHVVMRHGRDFRCSRRNCEKVFPSRESLRAHIHAHFFGGGATPGHSGGAGNGREEQFQTVLCAASCPASPSMPVRQRHPPAPSAPPPSSQSPGVPEESHTTELLHHHGTLQSHSSPPSVASSCFVVANGTAAGAVVGGITTPPPKVPPLRAMASKEQQPQQPADLKVSPPASISSSAAVVSLLSCQFCGAQLEDVQALQTHWLQQHVAQLARPHICADCDAGFTTAEALRAHQEVQHADGSTRNIQRIPTGQN